MEIASIIEKTKSALHRYKYAALVLFIGILLMVLPGFDTNSEGDAVQETEEQVNETVEENLKRILSRVDGAGDVDVLLTYAQGERIQYQTDTEYTDTADSSAHTSDTVIITDTGKNEDGLVVQIDPPVYLGAIIVSQGADKPAVKLALVEAVSKVTGLGANQITVLKMK